MEFEDVSERVEWECKRVAAAFGVVGWKEREDDTATRINQGFRHFDGILNETQITWGLWVELPPLEVRFIAAPIIIVRPLTSRLLAM